MEILLTLTTAGADTGPFDLYSDVDSYVSAFDTVVAKLDLEAGYATTAPDGTTIVRVQSTGLCTNYIDIVLVPPTTTSTSTDAPLFRSILLSNPPGESSPSLACAITTGVTKYISSSFAITNGLVIYNDTALTIQTYTSDPYSGNYAMLYDNDNALRYAVTFDSSGVVDTVTSC
jgi:hypothetical protein